MNLLKKIFRNRLMALVVLAGAMVASTGCDELSQLRNLMQAAVPVLQSPLSQGPLMQDMPGFDSGYSFNDPYSYDGSDDFFFDSDF